MAKFLVWVILMAMLGCFGCNHKPNPNGATIVEHQVSGQISGIKKNS